jgi:hypothetical protein
MPKANAEMARELARLSTDCSFLLTHLIRQQKGRNRANAKAILKSILDIDEDWNPAPLLRAGDVGWYSFAGPNLFNPGTSAFDAPANSKAVCFTESTLEGLKAHREVFGAKYGIAFDRDYLFKRGANPCLNLRTSLLKATFYRNGERFTRSVFNFIPPQLHPYVNVINESFDATHEREWRYAGDLHFAYSDAMFVFCPDTEFPEFAGMQTAGKPVLFDLKWLDRI